MLKKSRAWLLSGLVLSVALSAHAENAIHVTYAGSMGVVMDKALGPAFAEREHLTYQGQGEGAYGMARLLASKKVVADVFVSITPGPIEVLQKAGLVGQAVPVASTRMVIAYNPKSAFAPALEASKNANSPAWWKVLQSPGLRFGRTDAATDPQGQNIIFTVQLAEKYYRQPGLARQILGDVQNPQQVFGEGGLLTRLQAGQIDAASGYESATISAKLPYIALPDEINLSNPTFTKDWYDTVSLQLPDKNGQMQTLKPQPLVFYAAVLKNAPNPQQAQAFVSYLQSPEGLKLFEANGYGQPKGGAL
ncbi:molybdate/tungstate transport system substrate-binding protein [Pseudomonas sp. BIGb0450]|uniref:extracellular solute-binding protein n=1 Tax=unclassified Pseudomonas TaxID=196821 RepID=UPI002169C56B|nr:MULTISPECIES: extracellular solute-binding protein [unclassified Pseudomonas]MCS3416467.1 molybdate/tungstate transport system substrate-binding protein [Pseudomonas sp. BIGb0558]MCS3435748.1 molybdate/tungstate transport system substrate-binding protein [Pseudomonas sp. BIGb0450]